MKRYIVFICVLALGCAYSGKAQEERTSGIIWSSLRGLEYSVRAGFNIGGTAPVPLPQEIRSIDGYSPTFCLSIEGDVRKWFGQQRQWGMKLGVRAENKGMETKATVKNYGMEIIGSGGEKLKGNWTGGVQTQVKNAYISIPVVALYQLNNRVHFSAGPYVSFLASSDFSGYVYDGYLREKNPTGTKVEFMGDSQAPYDFADSQRKVLWGAQVGTEWKAFKHLIVYADLTWGLNSIFPKDFDTITFAMYPIYLNVGFGYAF